MRSCHAAIAGSTPTTQQALEQLQAFIAERRASTKPALDLEQFERELHERVLAVEREMMAAELAKLDVDQPVVRIDGVPHRRVLRSEQTYWGVAGPFRVERSLYSTREGDPAACPMELRAGIVDGRWTPWAAQQAAWVVAHLTPQQGEDLFARLGGLSPSKSSLDRLPKALSERWEAGRVDWEEALRSSETVPEEAVAVAVSLDGVLVPMKDGERARKREEARGEGKRTKGPAGYSEAGCATLSFYDRDGRRLSTIQFARMPERKKETLKAMLSAELEHVLAQRPDLTLVKLADGARDNWDYLSAQLPPGVELVDFYHAAEHLRLALAEAYGETNPRGLAQFEKLRRVLLEDFEGADKVIRALRYLRDKHPRRKKVQAELTYFRRNRERMHYGACAAAKLPIGSGVVEAACKTLVTQRMKCSGMRWRHGGGQAILTLRSLLQSRDRFDRGWALLLATYKARVTVPENVVAFSSRSHVSA
jgi:hypothetical protein